MIIGYFYPFFDKAKITQRRYRVDDINQGRD